MGRYFSLALDLPGAASRSKPKVRSKMKLRADFGFWIALMLVVVGVFYLLEVNSLSTQGYELKRLDKTLAETRTEHDKLEMEAASLKSIQNVDAEIKNLNLVPSSGMKYLPTDGFSYR